MSRFLVFFDDFDVFAGKSEKKRAMTKEGEIRRKAGKASKKPR